MAAICVAIDESLECAAGYDDPPAEAQGGKLAPGDEFVSVGSRTAEELCRLGHGEDESFVTVHGVS